MNLLVIGGGGREHAIVHTLKKSPKVDHIWCAPGNGGIAKYAKCFPVKATDIDGMVKLAKELAKKMRQAAAELNFEEAARLRDRMKEVKQMLLELEG